jgi:hypothetical protein
LNYKLIYHESKQVSPQYANYRAIIVNCYYPDQTDDSTPYNAKPLLFLAVLEGEDYTGEEWRLMTTPSEAQTIREAIRQFDQYYTEKGGTQ